MEIIPLKFKPLKKPIKRRVKPQESIRTTTSGFAARIASTASETACLTREYAFRPSIQPRMLSLAARTGSDSEQAQSRPSVSPSLLPVHKHWPSTACKQTGLGYLARQAKNRDWGME